ncbi:MAG: aldehyde ferredoxin oxidoreductase family protein [Planctomycetota bacterium]
MEKKLGGYAGKILHVHLDSGKFVVEPVSRESCTKFIGGRGRDAKLIFNTVSPKTSPLSKENIVCISTGPVTGLLGPTAGRVNVAAISPLTGIYGNSNVGAHWGPELKYAGFDGIVFHGKAKSPVYLVVEDDNCRLEDACKISGKGVFDTNNILKEKLGEDFYIAAVGPSAENGVLFGSVIFDNWDAAGRTGTGTVLAAKNVKAIAVRGSGAIEVADVKGYLSVVREGWRAILEDPGFRSQEHPALGTAICVNWGNAQGWLPTRNFREACFEGAEQISGEEFRDRLSTRISPYPGGRACLSCPNRCKRFGRIESGKYAGTSGNIEFEGIAAFGSKCGVSDLDAVFHAFMLSNDYGLDCVSCGNMIATFMELNECGILPEEIKKDIDLKFGDADAMVEAVHRIATRKGALGELGALGAAKATARIGGKASYYTSSIKGIDTIACDPRVAKGFGFTYAVSTRGSDHLRAHPVYEMVGMPSEISKELFGSEGASKLTSYDGKVRMVVWHEDIAAVTDSMGTCRFMQASYYPQDPIPELLYKYGRKKSEPHSIKYHEWLTAATGIEYTYEDILKAGERIILIERAINLRRGMKRKDDTLPERFFKEPIPEGPSAGEIFDRNRFEEMLDEYYTIRGLNKIDARISKKKLKSLGLSDIADVLTKEKLAF